MIELTDGIILSKSAPKEGISFSLDKGQINQIPLEEKYKFNFLKLKDQSLDKGVFKIDDITIYPNEENQKSIFFLQVNSLIKVGLCFVVDKDKKKEKVKEVQNELITLRDLPTETEEENNAKIAAIFNKIRSFSPSYIILDLNEQGNKDNDYLLQELEKMASDVLVIVLEKKVEEIVEVDKPTIDTDINVEQQDDFDEVVMGEEITSLEIGTTTVESVEKAKKKSKREKKQYIEQSHNSEEDFIQFSVDKKNFVSNLFCTFKDNIMVFLSFLIPTTGVIAFLILSPLYYQTNKALLIPFIITIVICFVLYIIMSYKCTSFYLNKKDSYRTKKIIFFNIINIVITLLGIALGIGIFLLFKNFDKELKVLETDKLGIVLVVVFSLILLTANFYISYLVNFIKRLFKRKK